MLDVMWRLELRMAGGPGQLIDIVIAGGLTVTLGFWSLYVLVAAQPPWGPELAVAAAAAHVAIAVRRRWPAVSFGVATAACGVLVAPGGATVVLPSAAMFPFSLYSYCAWGRRPAPAAGLAIGVAAAAITAMGPAAGLQVAGPALPPPFLFGFAVAVVLVAWSLGLFRRVQLAYFAALDERARHAEADREERARHAEADREERARRVVLEERARIAREMHDVVAHSLSAIVTQAHGRIYAGHSDPGRSEEVLTSIAEIGRQALDDMRGVLEVMGDDPSPGKPSPSLGDLAALLERSRASGVDVSFAETGTPRDVGPAAGLAVYRLVQEALTSTLQHAGPGAHAEVHLDWSGDELMVTVWDDGRDPARPDAAGSGPRLIGMRERMAAVGGSVTAGSESTPGFVVRAVLPLSSGGENLTIR
jgi:signal transduction histidine kinase